MPDREKVIKGLEYCMGGCSVSCFKCPYRDPGVIPPDCLDNCTILQDAVELLKESAPGWIGVKDRLPDDASDVLAYYDSECECRIAPVNYYKGVWYDCVFNRPLDTLGQQKITHWMSLPEPPKESEAE